MEAHNNDMLIRPAMPSSIHSSTQIKSGGALLLQEDIFWYSFDELFYCFRCKGNDEVPYIS
jgi:hypothetical protein